VAAVLAAGTTLVACQPIKPVNPPGPPHGTRTFSCVGHLETFFVPDGVTEITVDAFGAQGGPATDGTPGGLGGGFQGTLHDLGGGEVLQVTVGCQPPAATPNPPFGFHAAPGGFNGGGPGGAALGLSELVNAGGGGGGASVVRVANTGETFIAGGGGGGGGSSPDLCIGGFGGGTDAGDGGTCGANMEGGGARFEPPSRVFFGKGGTAYGPCCPRPENGTDGGSRTGGTGGAVTCESPDGCHSGAGGGGGEGGGGGGGGANAGAPTSGGGGGGGGAGKPPLDNTGMTAGVRAGGGEVVLTW
jgi:hypothetical protein